MYGYIYIYTVYIIYNFLNEVSCVLNVEAPLTSLHFREFVLKNSVVVMDFRRTGVAIALSHLARSFLSSDTRTELLIEISQFRAEISKAEATLQQTSLVLGHCNSYSNFLVYVVKLLAFSEICLQLWIFYLLVAQRSVRQPPAILDHPDPDSSSSEADTITGTQPVAEIRRTGPVRPSDLKKIK